MEFRDSETSRKIYSERKEHIVELLDRRIQCRQINIVECDDEKADFTVFYE